jgi:tetratricopeptide (TPR) repeat protein
MAHNNAHFQRGMLLLEQGRYQEAAGELRMQLTGGPDDYLPHFGLALCLSELEQHDEATRHAQQAIHLAPDLSLGHYALARVLIARHRYDEARAAIEEAIRLDPYDANYFSILASLELHKSRWREALAAADQGLAIDPEHGPCTNLRAQALVKLGDRAAAAATMDQALARRPDDPYTHANQGWALLHEGKPYPAMEHFREALRLDPELEWARAGIVEAMKARNFIYRWMLAWFLWMSRLSPQVRWMLILGALFGSQFIQRMAAQNPTAAPYLRLVLYAYFAFVLMSWLSPSLFNLLLRLDRFGRYALSRDQIRGANVLAVCLVVTLSVMTLGIARGNWIWLYSALMFALLSLPASAIYVCDAGWPRQAMIAITLLLMFAVLVVFSAGMFTAETMPVLVALLTLGLLPILPWAMLGSQFAAMYLANVKPRK